ncbi:CpaF family protein [Micromonospora gifhornensis]|uniref:CpaF family protein n=1 Tax=Micromonospora gifhornensis TaxID=84594 RepID=UPI0036466C8E
MPDRQRFNGASWPPAATRAANGAHPPTNGVPITTLDEPAPPPSIDYTAVRELRRRISEQLTIVLRDTPNVSHEHRQAEGERIAARVVREHVDALGQAGQPVSLQQEAELLDAVAADLFGLGRLQSLLDRQDIVNVHIIGCDNVRIEHIDGRISVGPPVADSDDELVSMCQVLAMRAGATERSLSASKPWLDMQLPDGSRLTVIYQVAVRPYVVIRKHTLIDVTLEDLRDKYGAIDPLLYDFLTAAVDAGLNIMIAGLADAGKTTMLRGLSARIPENEQYITLEESRELGTHRNRRWVMSLEAREGHGARAADGRPAGEVTISDMIPITLRLSVQRIIVGEVRSREIVPMLQAMSTSRGSMCTIHARNSRSVIDRIIELALQHGPEMTADLARRMAAGAIDLIVYITVEDETRLGGRKHRYVSEVVEVGGMHDDRMVTTTIFGPGPDGRAVPRHLPERLRAQLLRAGYDPRLLTGYIQLGDDNRGAWTTPLTTLTRRR